MLTGTISQTFLCGSTLYVKVVSPSGQVAFYEFSWAAAQADGIPGILAAIQSAGVSWAQPVPDWTEQLIGQIVEF